MDAKGIKQQLKRCEFFQTLTEDELNVLREHATFKQLARGKILYRKGEQSNDTFCLLLSGSVDIVAKDGRVVKAVGGCEVIGEVALSSPYQVRSVSVIVKDPVELLEWNVRDVKEKIPIVWEKLLKLAWKHMKDYYEE